MAHISDATKVDYGTSTDWQDVIPIPQNEGSDFPLAAIAYTEEYSQAVAYLRAVMANNEKSQRALKLTEHVIGMNPAHYTVWLFRAATLQHLSVDPKTELAWLDKIALKHLKNYQIWHHRQTIMCQLSALPSTELNFLSRMLAKDAKNYHVWSYRGWLVRHFGLWPTPDVPGSELDFTRDLIRADVMNNSAWNHRFLVLFDRNRVDETHTFEATRVPTAIWEREFEFTKTCIRSRPQNQASWNYLVGITKKKGDNLKALKDFAQEFADIEKIDEISSSFALELLADVYSKELDTEKVTKIYDLLAKRFDPIRKNYWQYRLEQWDLETARA